MSKPTRRQVENNVEQLKEESEHLEADPLIMNLASFSELEKAYPDKGEADNPELVIQPWPDKKPQSLSYAIPNYIPENFLQCSFLIVYGDNPGKFGIEPESTTDAVAVTTLWDSLSEADLQREYKYRVEHDEQIPDVLQPYASE